MARPARPGTREHLLDAARAEFGRAGPGAARVEDIARRAGVSKGAFYLHFESKQAALVEIVQRLVGALEEMAERRDQATHRLWAEPPADTAEVQARFEAEVALDVDLLEVLWRHRHLIAAVDGAAGPRVAGLVDGFKRRLRAAITGRIRARQEAGQLRDDVSPAVVADLVMGTYLDLIRRMAGLREKPDLAAWERDLLVIIYQGLLTRRSPTSARRIR